MRKDYMAKWNDTYAGYFDQIKQKENALNTLERQKKRNNCVSNPSRKSTLSIEKVLSDICDSATDFLEDGLNSASDKGAYGDFPLHKVAIWGDVDFASVLLENGADINAIGEDDETALHRAIAGKKLEMIEFLISQGADLTIKNIYGNTAIDDAITTKNDAIISLFK